MQGFYEHPKFAIFFIVFTVFCFGGVLIFSNSIDSSDYGTSVSKDRKWSKSNSAYCQSQSDTYYKCGWNMIEDRCVCKLR